MKQMILASGNAHKLEEISEITKNYNIELKPMKDVGLADYEIIEDGETFEENSYIKAKAVLDIKGVPTIADDSGLMVACLDGAPGVYSARYSGENATYESNNRKLLNALKDVPMEDRDATFVTVITLLFPNGDQLIARGEVKGKITFEPKGDLGFGYDPLFYIPEKDKTFAQMSSEEKNELSHRAIALKRLKLALDEYYKEK